MVNEEVVYTFRAVDEISGPMKRAQAVLTETADSLDSVQASGEEAVTQTVRVETALDSATSKMQQAETTAETSGPKAEERMNAVTDAADRATQAQNKAVLQSIQTLTAMQALQSGLSAITSSVQTLGIVDEETAETLKKVTAGVQLVVGTAQAVKGVVTLFQSLNAVLKTTAIVSTFASIAENPLKGAAIVGAAGLAAGAVGGYMMSSLTQTKTTTINVSHESTARQAQTLVDAGAWY